MGGIRPAPDEVLLGIFKRAKITEREHDHINSLIRNMYHVPRPSWATNPSVIELAALHARIDIKKEQKRIRRMP
ncbi:MAG: hypothetical protein HYV51_02850 [Parcubacteria group bacterium]|nr:hypothetical protein [Parcubacteria group bacterium]